MVKPFHFARLPRILFGNGMISELASNVKSIGNKVILVTGASSFIKSENAGKLFDDFKKKAIEFKIITINGEPSPEVIDKAVRELYLEKFDIVVGIGGGSVLDSGKAVSAMMFRNESVTEFLEGVGVKEHPGTKIPYIAVPTTSGTGSEATKNAVISKVGENGFKRSLRHDNFVPDIAIVDPGLTLNVPPDLTATCGMDCFTQLTEAFLSNKSNEFTDALAVKGLFHVKESLLRTYSNGEDIDARSGMSFAALTSGISLANAGLVVVHGFASSLGGEFNIPHGLICGSLMAPANEINVKVLRRTKSNPAALKKYAQLGELFLDDKGRNEDYYIDGFIQYLHRISHMLGISGLKQTHLDEKHMELICNNTEIKNNPVKLDAQELMEILHSLP